MCVVCYAARDRLWVTWKESCCVYKFVEGVGFTNQVTLRNARCNSKDSVPFLFLVTSGMSIVSGSQSPQHGTSSGCKWRNGLQYGGLLKVY